ncbi:MAG TPA: DUF3060 domain-containing protein [Pyrinomonadaceae bacterium]
MAIVLSTVLLGCVGQSTVSNASNTANQATPTPERLARIEEKVDPADVVQADVSEPGPTLLVSEETDKTNLNCDKYNRAMINSSDNKITITGACSQIMVNGHRNQITAVAAAEITTYGSGNTVEYSKFVNGKKPTITDTSGSNTITKVSSTPVPASNK